MFNCITVLLLIASLALSACASAPGGGRCDDGLCVKVELAEPIRMNEPVAVTITVETEEDIPGLGVYLGFSAPDIVVEGERKWVVDAKAQTPIHFSTTIRFPPREGYYDVIASAHDHRIGRVVQDYVPVRITTLGGTLNPPSERESGTPAPLERLEVTPTPFTSPLSTPAPTPYPTCPEEFDTTLPDVPLEEWVPHCDWSSGVERVAPMETSLWEGTTVWVAFPEDIFPHKQYLAHNVDGTSEWMEIPSLITIYAGLPIF